MAAPSGGMSGPIAAQWKLTPDEREMIAATIFDVFTTEAAPGEGDTESAARLLEARLSRMLGDRGQRGYEEGRGERCRCFAAGLCVCDEGVN